MALLGKTVKDVYEAMLTAYQTSKYKRQGAKDALELYEQNLGFVEDTREALVDVDDLVDALRVMLSVKASTLSRCRKAETRLKTLKLKLRAPSSLNLCHAERTVRAAHMVLIFFL